MTRAGSTSRAGPGVHGIGSVARGVADRGGGPGAARSVGERIRSRWKGIRPRSQGAVARSRSHRDGFVSDVSEDREIAGLPAETSIGHQRRQDDAGVHGGTRRRSSGVAASLGSRRARSPAVDPRHGRGSRHRGPRAEHRHLLGLARELLVDPPLQLADDSLFSRRQIVNGSHPLAPEFPSARQRTRCLGRERAGMIWAGDDELLEEAHRAHR